jgi:hypothetical protein
LTGPTLIVDQNVPNPFHQTTAFRVQVSEALSANITISDLAGRVILQRSEEFEKGLHHIEVFREQLGSPGLYLFKMSTGSQQITKKMILLQ